VDSSLPLSDMRQLAAALRWAAARLDATNPDRDVDFSEGVDWATAELRALADAADNGSVQ